MLYGKIWGLLLLVGVGQIFSLERAVLPPLVTYDGHGHFRVDANFKRHHQALVDCVSFTYMRDIARGLARPDRITLPEYVDFAKGFGVYDLSAFVREAHALSGDCEADLERRGYQLQVLAGFTGIDLAEEDRSTLFAYCPETNTQDLCLSNGFAL